MGVNKGKMGDEGRMEQRPMLSGVIRGSQNEVLSPWTAVFSSRCLYCKRKQGDGEVMFALPDPYNGLLHQKCAPFYSYDGNWPHEFPLVSYFKV